MTKVTIFGRSLGAYFGRRRAGRLLAAGREAEGRGDLAGACEHYRAAARAAGGRSAAAYLHLGVALEALGEVEAAFEAFAAALASDPSNPDAHYNLGRARFARGDLQAAEQDLRAALAGRPEFPEALAVLGMLYHRRELWDEAAALLARAAAANPRDALSRSWLGSLLVDQGRWADAARYLNEALALDPHLALAHLASGNLHAADRNYAEATACYRRALALEPGNVQAHLNLANALAYLGETAEARACCDAALALDPENAAARWIRAMAGIPAVRASSEALGETRRRFREELEALDRWFDGRRAAEGHRVVGIQQPFWLAYQDADNVEMLRIYGRLCTRLMGAWQERVGRAPPPRSGGPLRVAVVSQYFRRHAVWEALVRGWFQELDRDRFELHAFHLGSTQDAETAFARSRAAQFHQGPRPLHLWIESIQRAQPHVILYPEIGMDPMTLKLASLRLAPLQAGTWGHPETTGLPTIDCFLSAQALEPEAAQAHYTEKLVALPGLGCCVASAPETPASAALPDLPEGVPLLLCPGTAHKYAPEHDGVFPAIARALGDCCLVFFASRPVELSQKLRQRLDAAFARAGLEPRRFVRFLPWLPRPEFHALVRQADAMLDTIGFSGFNTALQAIGGGLPVVGYEGRFLRGRLASGALRHIGMGELVATGEREYVELAVSLATDRERRARLRRSLEAARPRLYHDTAPIRALEDVLAGYSSVSR